MGTAQRWISGLLTSAIVGALVGFLVNLLASRIVPEYWWFDSWIAAGCGAVGAMLAHCYYRRR
jgi:H+/Cl- antiporter ClcA